MASSRAFFSDALHLGDVSADVARGVRHGALDSEGGAPHVACAVGFACAVPAGAGGVVRDVVEQGQSVVGPGVRV